MKNLLLFSTLLLATSSIFAQLTVKPTATNADSFVYVNNQVLYVKNGIDLTRNISLANGTTDSKEASIYLRNNGQLIQGNDTANSGDGQLSVQQNTPETNAWAYYYWCSPIGDPGVIGVPNPVGNQNFGVRQFYEALPTLSQTAARKVSTTSSLNGFTNPLTISTRWLYTFLFPGTEREGNYQAMGTGANAPAGFGFTMKGVGLNAPGGNQVYEFRGRPNNGTFSIRVLSPQTTVGNPDPEAQMTFTGNPYPSALDLNRLFYDSGNEELGAIWYYDEDRTVASHYYSQKPFGYGVWVPEGRDLDLNYHDNNPQGLYTAAPFSIYNANGGSTPTDSLGGANQHKRYAPIGQGLMFVGKNDFGPTSDSIVKIKNSHRIYIKEDTPGSVFQRPEADTAFELEENNIPENSHFATIADTSRVDTRTPMMRIYTIFNEAVTRDMVLAFFEDATDGYDRGMDGLSAQDLKTDAYFPIGDDNRRLPYVINGIRFHIDKKVPIAFKLRYQTKFDVKVVQEIKKPYTNAYIYDSVENTYSQITRGQSATFNLPAGTYNNRFFIVFHNRFRKGDLPETKQEAEREITNNVTFFQNNSVQQLEVKNPEGYVIKAASVYDMAGKLVISEKNLGDKTNYSFYTGNLSSGVYLVKLITAEDVIIDYKAIVHNR